MTTSNLATCIAPSLLWDSTKSISVEAVGVAVKLVDHVLVRAAEIWSDAGQCIELLHADAATMNRRPRPSDSLELTVDRTVSTDSVSDVDESCNRGEESVDFVK